MIISPISLEKLWKILLPCCEWITPDPEHIVRMTWYITDKKEYLANLKEMGAIYREVIGKNYPTMACVEVSALMEDKAKIEIETTAVVEEN